MNEPGSVKWILKAISDGLAIPPEQIRLGIILIVSFIIGLIILSILQGVRHSRELRKRSRQVYQFMTRKYRLTPSDHDLIRRMSVYLRRGERVNMLFLDDQVFDRAASRIMQIEREPVMRIDALRMKIHRDEGKLESNIASSRHIPAGKKVMIACRGGTRIQGVVTFQDETRFGVEMKTALPALAAGGIITVFFHSPEGVFRFSTRILKVSGRILEAEHSGEIVRFQRRRFFRREVAFPVRFRIPGGSKAGESSWTVDLSGGGVSIRNTGEAVRVGDLVTVGIPLDGEEVSAGARVVRISEQGQVLHLEFTGLIEADRDRIIKTVLSKALPSVK